MSESEARARAAPAVAEGPPVADPFARRECDGLPIPLSVKLAEGELVVGDLLGARPGEVIHLETPVGEPSLLLAGDTVIASGELVEIKGRLNFRVTRLGSRHG